MKQKVLAIVLAAVFALAACGNHSGKGVAVTGTAETERSADLPIETAAPETTAPGPAEPEAAGKGTKASDPEALESAKQENKTEASRDAEKPKPLEAPKSTEKPKNMEPSKAAETPKTTEKQTSAKDPAAENVPKAEEQPSFEQPVTEAPHTCVWDGGSVTAAASCTIEGAKTYTCTGCGKTRTESIPKTAHNYVTESKPATCTEAGSTRTYCSICGEVQSETSSGVAGGHHFVKEYWPSEPTCQAGGSYNLICSVCGENGGHGSEPALDHTPVSREETHGDCTHSTIVVTECSVCGAELGRESYFEDEHDWVETTDQVFNEQTLEWETVSYSYCSRCHAQK